MSATIAIDDTQLRARLNQLASYGLDMGRVLKVETRRLLAEIIKRTPPTGGNSRTGYSGSSGFTVEEGTSARKQGENAVRWDVERIVNAMDPSFIQFLLKNNKDTFPRVSTIWLSGSTKFVKDIEHLGMTKGDVAQFHEKMRSPNTGRTPMIRQKGMQSRDYIGRNKARIMMAAPKPVVKDYVKSAIARVGKMKGGWGPAARALGMKLPGWINRHANASQGWVVPNLGRGPSPSITVGNVSRGVAAKVASAVKRAIHNRTVSIGQNLKRMLKYGPGASGDYGYARA